MKVQMVLDLVNNLIGDSEELGIDKFNMMTRYLNDNEEKELINILQDNDINIVDTASKLKK